MIREGLAAFKGKRVLLLQGPLGPFFRRLARDLETAGATVRKIDFNGGDWLFSPRGAVSFRDGIDAWPAYLERTIAEWKIDTIFLFGDCRPVHRAACEVARRRGLEIGVFEEGYVRPDYVTLERSGVNANSLIPRSPRFYNDIASVDVQPTRRVGNTFWHAASWAVAYYLASAALRPLFGKYNHHRPLALRESAHWLRSLVRKGIFAFGERGTQAELATTLSGKYFLVPLQVHNDAQIHVHSPFRSVESFIESVMASFSRSAPEDTILVIKHHPMDRGYHDYRRTIRGFARAMKIDGRVRYIHDQHLPTLLDHARGVVVVNSTVGLSALHHGTPVKTCGSAIYDMEGLTYQGELEDFWDAAAGMQVDRDLYRRFVSYLIGRTQLNGSFYRRLSGTVSSAGIIWSMRGDQRTHARPASSQVRAKPQNPKYRTISS